jgi:hypothetical protein
MSQRISLVDSLGEIGVGDYKRCMSAPTRWSCNNVEIHTKEPTKHGDISGSLDERFDVFRIVTSGRQDDDRMLVRGVFSPGLGLGVVGWG